MPPRRSRLPFGFTSLPDFKVSGPAWEKLEIAYRHAVPQQARAEIIAATTRMVCLTQAALSARPLSETTKRIDQFEKAAANLLSVFTAPGPSASIHFAATIIEQELKELLGDSHDHTFDDFHDRVLAFAVACGHGKILAALLAAEGTDQAFGPWIRDLTHICKRHQLPTGARRDTDKNKTGTPSPFVALVAGLQKLLPEKYQHGRQSDAALAKVIKIARRSGPNAKQ